MAQLAIRGGTPAIQTALAKPWPLYGDLERDRLNEVLESGLWNCGRRDNPFFVGPRGDMDRILDAIRNLRANQDELRQVNSQPYQEN